MSITSLRTQIILPKELREEIDRQRHLNGESLADYIRKAAKERVKKGKKKKADLKKLAGEFVGAAKGTKTKTEVNALVEQIREERRSDDEHRMKRLREAMK